MSGFQSPNYTQTPNDFFAMLPEMSDAETKVTLVMIRKTFGFHKDKFKMGISKLADAAGLSRQGALDGARAAEQRGTFKRTNPDAQGEAEWKLILDEPLNSLDTPLKPVEGNPQASRGQVGVKETIKKKKKKIKEVAQAPKPLKANQIPQIILYRSVTGKYPPKALQFKVIVWVDKVGDRLGREVTADDLRPFLEEWLKRGYNPMAATWLSDWAVPGNVPQRTNGNGASKSSYDAIDRVLGAA